MNCSGFKPEILERTPRRRSGVIATGVWEGKNYRMNVTDSLTDWVDFDATVWAPQYAVALENGRRGYLEGWWNTTQEQHQVQQVRSLISRYGLEFATRFVVRMWDSQALAFTVADSPWGSVQGISFGVGDENEHRRQAQDLMDFLHGDWADVALEAQEGEEWVRLKAIDMPNSECNDGDDMDQAQEEFEDEVTGRWHCGDRFSFENTPEMAL